jgi:pimeloyl-ACP methyl ester carboxylesterase
MTVVAAETLAGFRTPESRARYLAAYEAALQAWPVPYEARVVPTGLGSTHVVASGPADGPPLFLLPSLAAGAVVWRLNATALSRIFRTYAVDVVGQPGKSIATRRPRRAADYAGWLADVMDGLGIERAALVGCSFGGFIAANQALATPDRVSGLVMISPVGVFASQALRLFYLMRISSVAARLTSRLRRASGGVTTMSALPRPADPLWASLMIATMTERPGVRVISPPVFSTAQLRAIRAPALLLIGDGEMLYEPRAMLDLARRRMPALQTELIPGGDHIAAMARPEDVNDRIIRFLRPAREAEL